MVSARILRRQFGFVGVNPGRPSEASLTLYTFNFFF